MTEQARRIRIRPAGGQDLDALVELLRTLFAIEADFDFDPKRQRRGLELMLAEGGIHRILLAADTGGEVVGMASAQSLVSTAEGGTAVLVEDVVVAEAWRGRGIGRMLVGAVEEWAARRGAARLQLLADRDNDPALRFYAAIGWQRTRLMCLRKKRAG